MIVSSAAGWSVAVGRGRTFSLCDSKRRKSFYNGEGTTIYYLPLRFAFDAAAVNETKSKSGIGLTIQLVIGQA